MVPVRKGILHQGLQGREIGRERGSTGGTGSRRAEPWLHRAETQPGEKLPPSPGSTGPAAAGRCTARTGGCSPKAPGESQAGCGGTGAGTRRPSASAPGLTPSQDSRCTAWSWVKRWGCGGTGRSTAHRRGGGINKFTEMVPA